MSPTATSGGGPARSEAGHESGGRGCLRAVHRCFGCSPLSSRGTGRLSGLLPTAPGLPFLLSLTNGPRLRKAAWSPRCTF